VDLLGRLVSIGDAPLLELQGEIDLATVPLLRDQLTRALGLHPGVELLVDLDGVTVLDDTGLGVLLGAAAQARDAGGDLVVVCTSERLLHRLARTGLDRAISVRRRASP
jgi:anti-sigma B factor antagonist